MAMTNSLRHAIQREEFLLHFQPLVDASSGDIVGMEALLRWQHPERGLLSASDFVPLLEESGLIVPVGKWVLREACRQNRLWQLAGLPQLCISVNLSARQFQKGDLVDMVSSILQENEIDPKLLQLEITESVLMDQSGTTLKTLEYLRKLGVRIAIDDFGTGYSSLNYLKQYPFDTLKFDRTFIHDMTQSENGAAIVAAVINLGHSVNMAVVAEGVETNDQVKLLQERGCDQYQGYLFAHPMSASKSISWLQKYSYNTQANQA
jgi:EAL domain-containing protein (putative c-di-GMP-specific phosphodiesterase class I)